MEQSLRTSLIQKRMSLALHRNAQVLATSFIGSTSFRSKLFSKAYAPKDCASSPCVLLSQVPHFLRGEVALPSPDWLKLSAVRQKQSQHVPDLLHDRSTVWLQ